MRDIFSNVTSLPSRNFTLNRQPKKTFPYKFPKFRKDLLNTNAISTVNGCVDKLKILQKEDTAQTQDRKWQL